MGIEKWQAESRRIRSKLRALPPDWPFHGRPDLKVRHDAIQRQMQSLLWEMHRVRQEAMDSPR